MCIRDSRYVDMLLSASQNAPDEQRRHELRMMARVCARVPEEPPETLHEALQAVWFVFVLCHSTMEFIPDVYKRQGGDSPKNTSHSRWAVFCESGPLGIC